MLKPFAKCPISSTVINNGRKEFVYINRRINMTNVLMYDINVSIFTDVAYPCIRFSMVNKHKNAKPAESYTDSVATLEIIDWIFATKEERNGVIAWLDDTYAETAELESEESKIEFDNLGDNLPDLPFDE
ncbi:hypothetical protein DSECCO2_119910 [anaerobic digester metagenome]